MAFVERAAKLIHEEKQFLFVHFFACLSGKRTPVLVFGNLGHVKAILIRWGIPIVDVKP
jgi:hypothetical protein